MTIRNEVTYLSKEDNDYCSIELVTNDNIQEQWESNTIDLQQLLTTFGIDKTDVEDDNTVEVRSIDNDNPPSTESLCYQLETEINDRDEEHGTTELESIFIDEFNVPEQSDLSTIERIHQYCKDNNKWDDWYEALDQYINDHFD